MDEVHAKREGSARERARGALDAFLTRHPDAMVGAITDTAIPTDVPAATPLGPGHRLAPAQSKELVVEEDYSLVIAAWGQARVRGVGRSTVHLRDAPDELVDYYCLDQTGLLGVYLTVFTSHDESAERLGSEMARPSAVPRFARNRRDASAAFVDVDDAFTELLGWTREDLIGTRSILIVHPEDHALSMDAWMDMMLRPGPGIPIRVRYRTKDDRWIWMEVTNVNRLKDPEHRDILAEMVNVNDEMEAAEALRANERLLRELAETVPLGLAHMDVDGTIFFMNSQLGELVGSSDKEHFEDLLETVLDEDQPAAFGALASVYQSRQGADLEIRVQPTPDEPIRHCALRLRPLLGDDGQLAGAIACLEDITAAFQLRQQLERQATRDPLTSCHNKASTRDSLLGALRGERGRRRGAGRRAGPTGVAVVFVDMDEFKPINDERGHAIGDEVLVVAAERLRATVREGDVVGRIGGDEFLIVCPEVGDAAEAELLAARISDRLCRTAAVSDGRVAIKASIGVAWCPTITDREADPEEVEGRADALVGAADTAMYRSKSERRCRPAMATEADFDPGAVPAKVSSRSVAAERA